jgi:hypothetical protein
LSESDSSLFKGRDSSSSKGDDSERRKSALTFLKKLLLQNQQAKFNHTGCKASLGEENPILLVLVKREIITKM